MGEITTLAVHNDAVAALTEDQAQAVAVAVREIVTPVMTAMAEMLDRNNQALERIAASNAAMAARIGELEKQVRLKTPLSRGQEKHVNDAIKARAAELMESKGYGADRKAVTKVAGMIRKSVLARYGVGTLREAPACDYEVALEAAKRWNDIIALRDVVKEAKRRAEDTAAAE